MDNILGDLATRLKQAEDEIVYLKNALATSEASDKESIEAYRRARDRADFWARKAEDYRLGLEEAIKTIWEVSKYVHENGDRQYCGDLQELALKLENILKKEY